MKAAILDLLKRTDAPLSGQAISARLGISRVAVWKHICRMREAGLDIQSGPKGYRLVSLADTPLPWIFGGRSARVHHYPELRSTMDKAQELARSGCPDFSVVVTDQQTLGRGRLQRNWQSQSGGLYFTMILRPRLAPSEGPLINLAAALDMAATLRDTYGIEARVKWPNDVLAGEGKIAGILSQMAAEADRVHYICLGIGVNINNSTTGITPPAVSVAELIGRAGSRAVVLSGFCDRFEHRMKTLSPSAVVAEWKAGAITLGRQVKVQILNETIEGQAVDMDDQGGLIVVLPDGTRRTMVYGDCFHVAKDT